MPSKEWIAKNKERFRATRLEYASKNIEKIKTRRQEYYRKNKERMCEYGRQYHLIHGEERRKNSRLYYQNNKEQCKERSRRNCAHIMKRKQERCRTDEEYHKRLNSYQSTYRKNKRLRVLDMLGGRVCVYCGCDDVRFLEVNHRNGGGNRLDFKGKAGGSGCGRGHAFYGNILAGRRKTDDLEVACKVCNNLHYLKLKFGEEAVARYSLNWSIYRRKKEKKQK